MTNFSLSANAPIVGSDGKPTPEFYRYLIGLNKTADGASAGTITTAPGSGLAGGGTVSTGVSLSLAPNGVQNSNIRQSAGVSVIGRAFGSSGNVADITADDDNRVLSREGSQLAFRSFINGVSIGPDTAAPLVRCDTLEIDQTAASSTATTTHSIPVNINGTTMYLLLSSTP